MTAQHIFCASFVLTLISIGSFYAVFNRRRTWQHSNVPGQTLFSPAIR